MKARAYPWDEKWLTCPDKVGMEVEAEFRPPDVATWTHLQEHSSPGRATDGCFSHSMAVVLRSNSDLAYLPDHGFVGEEGGECSIYDGLGVSSMQCWTVGRDATSARIQTADHGLSPLIAVLFHSLAHPRPSHPPDPQTRRVSQPARTERDSYPLSWSRFSSITLQLAPPRRDLGVARGKSGM